MYIAMVVHKMSSILWLRASKRQFSPSELLVLSKTPLSSHLDGIMKTAAGGGDVAEEARRTFIQPLTLGHFSNFQKRALSRGGSGAPHAKCLLAVKYWDGSVHRCQGHVNLFKTA